MMEVLNQKWLFPENLVEAKLAQHQMAEKVITQDADMSVKYIAGVDISNIRFDPEEMIYAAIVVMSYPSLKIVEVSTVAMKQEFKYIPGFLGFREVPALVKAFNQLSIRPDLIMVDGHGISHPRGLGVASHLGVCLDIPTIGVAKSILVGTPLEPLEELAGSFTPLVYKGEQRAVMVRSKKRCSPIIISVGHKITLNTAKSWVNLCLKNYRLPEPTRQAHLAANIFRREKMQEHSVVT